MIQFVEGVSLDEIIQINSQIFIENFPVEHFFEKIKKGYLLRNIGFYDNGVLIGYCIVIDKHNEKLLHAWIGGVLPEFRGHGIFFQFYDWLIAEAKNLGYLEVTGNSDNLKPAMLITFIKKGFDIIGVDKTKYGDGKKIRFSYHIYPPCKIRLSITNHCNCDCFFCHHEGVSISEGRNLTIAEANTILIQARKIGVREITITGGEPLCCPDTILFIIKTCNTWSNPPLLKIPTNGILLTDRMCLKFNEYKGPIQLNVSLHSTDITHTSLIMGHSFESLPYMNCFQLIKDYGLNARINCTILRGINSSKDDINSIIKIAVKYGIRQINFMELLVTKTQHSLKPYYFPFEEIIMIIEDNFCLKAVTKSPKKNSYLLSSSESSSTTIKLNVYRLGCRAGCEKCYYENDLVIGADAKCYPCYLRPELSCGNAAISLTKSIDGRMNLLASQDNLFAKEELYWGDTGIKLYYSSNQILGLDIASIVKTDDYWQSKLAFDSKSFTDHIIDISFGNTTQIDFNQDKWIIRSGLQEFEYCYLLRVIIDHFLLSNGIIPFHAAAVSNKAKQFVIFTRSCGGKSYISNLLCENFSFFAIGDDHIYITEDYIFGNLKRRNRQSDNKNNTYTINTGKDDRRSVTAVFFSYSENNTCQNINSNEIPLLLDAYSGDKYACNPFVIDKKRIDPVELTSFDARTTYRNIVYNDLFVNTLLIDGTYEFAANCIKHISEGTTE